MDDSELKTEMLAVIGIAKQNAWGADLDRIERLEKALREPSGTDRLPDAAEVAEEIYNIYPRKVGKQMALRAIRKALRRTSPDEIMANLAKYRMSVIGEDRQFIPHCATYFNQGRYLEDPEEPEAAAPLRPTV